MCTERMDVFIVLGRVTGKEERIMLEELKDDIKQYWYVFLLILVGIEGISACCLWSKEEKITVNSLTWKTIVDVEELTPHYYYNRTYKPYNAYAVHSYVRYSDEECTTYYNYIVDEWDIIDTLEKTGERGIDITYAEPKLERGQRIRKSIKYIAYYKRENGKEVSEAVSKDVWDELPDSGKQAMVIFKAWGISEVEK